MNAWDNPMVRQKDIGEDLLDFVKDFEKQLKDEEAKTGEKVDDSELQMMKELVGYEIDSKKTK